MKIVQVKIKNFLKLKDVEFNPSQTNVIVGKNKQGKTSILKAIRTAFDGKADATSIRVGESKAEINIELEDLIIKRQITEKGNHLDISNKEGMKMPAPQKFLDGILGNFAFNPVEFFELKPADMKKYLLNAIKLNITKEELAQYTGQTLEGLDYEAHALEVVEQARKFYYDRRTVANSEVTKKKKAIEELKSQIPEGFNPESVSEEKIQELRTAIEKDKSEKQKHEYNQKEIISLQKQEADIKEQIATLQSKLTKVQDEIISKTQLEFDFSDDMSMEAFEETLKKMEGQRDIAHTFRRLEELRGELDIAMNEADKLDNIVVDLTKRVPEDLISKAKLPIDGLRIDGNDIFVNDININNMSSSEQLKFGLQIVRALNGELKLVCVDGLEAMDKETFEFFLKEIENDDFTYFVTRVDGNSPHSIVVEDGEIKTE